jgi:DNA primase
VRFRVDRVLASEDLGSAEGKDRAVEELRAVLGPLPASALRDELLAHAADRLDVVPVKLAEWLAQPPRGGAAQAMTRRGAPAAPAPQPGQAGSAAPPARTIVSPSARVERSFLIQCLVLPQEGRAALATLDLELDILTPAYRRAALLLMEKLGGPIQAPDDDEELARVLAELQVRAARATSSRAALEAERLRLELASLERRIQSAKTGGGGNIVELAQRREELQSLMERELEETLAQTKHSD